MNELPRYHFLVCQENYAKCLEVLESKVRDGHCCFRLGRNMRDHMQNDQFTDIIRNWTKSRTDQIPKGQNPNQIKSFIILAVLRRSV